MAVLLMIFSLFGFFLVDSSSTTVFPVYAIALVVGIPALLTVVAVLVVIMCLYRKRLLRRLKSIEMRYIDTIIINLVQLHRELTETNSWI